MKFNLKSLKFFTKNIMRISRQHILLYKYKLKILNKNQAPLSACQNRFYLLENHHGPSSIFTIKLVLSYTGKLDIDAFNKSVNKIIQENEILRTTFHVEKNLIFQKIHNNFHFKTDIHDLKSLNNPDEYENYIRNMASESFDLASLPLFKIHILQLENDQIEILSNFHHIIWDGWSQYKFYKELTSLYSHYLNNSPIPKNRLNMQYKLYCHIENDLNSKLKPGTIDFYRSYLAKNQVVSLPFLKNNESNTHTSKVLLTPMTTNSIKNIKYFCKKTGCTFNEFMLSAFLLHIYNYTKNEYISTMIPRFSRFHPQLQSAYGPMLNALPIIMKINPNDKYLNFIKNISNTINLLCKTDDIPIDHIINKIQNNDEDRITINPFQFLFNYISPEWTNPVTIEGLKFHKERLAIPELEYLMTLYISGDKKLGAVGITMAYQSDKIDPEMAKIFITNYLSLIDQILINPSLTLDQYRLVNSNTPSVNIDPARKMSDSLCKPLVEDLISNLITYSDKVAIIQDENITTYYELSCLTQAYFDQIEPYCHERKRTVIIAGARNKHFYAAIIASLAHGQAIYLHDMNSNPKYARSAISQINPLLAIIVNSGKENNNKNYSKLLSDKTPLLTIGNKNISEVHSFDTMLEKARLINSDDPAYTVFTSGSTGIPKGITGSHAGLAHFINWQIKAFNITSSDVAAQITNVSFDVVLREIFSPLLAGASLAIPASKSWLEEGDFFKWCIENKITFFHTVPSIFKIFLDEVKSGNQIILSELRWIFFAGEPLHSNLISEWKRLVYSSTTLINLYGPSETTLAKMYYPVPVDYQRGVQPLGKPITDSETYILRNDMSICSIGEPGEIAIRTPYRSLGYLDDSLNYKFKINPYTNDPSDLIYMTGDLGYCDHNNNYHIKGRIDDQIKINGIRIELGAIDYHLKLQNTISSSAVIFNETSPQLKEIIAYVALKSKSGNTSDDIKAILKQLELNLPNHMIPNRIILLDHMPRLASGKINKQDLIKMSNIQNTHIQEKEYTPPSTSTERMLHDLWLEMTSCKVISIHDRYQDLGFNSLKLVQFIIKLKNQHNVHLKPSDLINNTSIFEIAIHIDSRLKNQKITDIQSDQIHGMKISELKNELKQINKFNCIKGNKIHNHIFLTGATGFLGIYLLSELLKEHTSATVYCLVRAKSETEAIDRIINAFKTCRINPDDFLDRIKAIPGDLNRPCFGLDMSTYNFLSSQIDSIFHCGAQVNFLYGFDELKDVNISGTYNVIDFATHKVLKPISYISTAGIVPATKESMPVKEDFSLNINDDIEIIGGYAQTKWVAEHAIQDASKMGVPVSIYRVGRISGDYHSGYWPEHDFIYCFLHTIYQLQIIPDLDIQIDLLPVNDTAKMIVAIENQVKYKNEVYHLVNPNRLKVSELASMLNELGDGNLIKIIEYSQWRNAVLKEIMNDNPVAIAPFISLLPDDPSTLPRLKYDRVFEVKNAQAALDPTGIKYPVIDTNLLQRYLSQTRSVDN